MSDRPDPELLRNLDLLMNLELFENSEVDIDLLEAMDAVESESADTFKDAESNEVPK